MMHLYFVKLHHSQCSAMHFILEISAVLNSSSASGCFSDSSGPYLGVDGTSSRVPRTVHACICARGPLKGITNVLPSRGGQYHSFLTGTKAAVGGVIFRPLVSICPQTLGRVTTLLICSLTVVLFASWFAIPPPHETVYYATSTTQE